MAVQKIIGIWLVKIFFHRKLCEKLLVLEIDGHLNADIQIWTLNNSKYRMIMSLGQLKFRVIHNMSNE